MHMDIQNIKISELKSFIFSFSFLNAKIGRLFCPACCSVIHAICVFAQARSKLECSVMYSFFYCCLSAIWTEDEQCNAQALSLFFLLSDVSMLNSWIRAWFQPTLCLSDSCKICVHWSPVYVWLKLVMMSRIGIFWPVISDVIFLLFIFLRWM